MNKKTKRLARLLIENAITNATLNKGDDQKARAIMATLADNQGALNQKALETEISLKAMIHKELTSYYFMRMDNTSANELINLVEQNGLGFMLAYNKPALYSTLANALINLLFQDALKAWLNDYKADYDQLNRLNNNYLKSYGLPDNPSFGDYVNTIMYITQTI